MDSKTKQSYIFVAILVFATYMDLYHPTKVMSKTRDDYAQYMKLKTGHNWVTDLAGKDIDP
jgi:hypothetical protein